ncbi:translation elongation factor Ts [bacterium]|nr:translation elongation factor Ts [bacterium]
MAEVTVEMIKSLRQKTNCGIMDCKRALISTDADEAKAIELLRKKGLAKAIERRERSAADGALFSYIHHTNKLGVMVELNCETDFVARTEEFKELGLDLCMQIAAENPQYVSREEIPADVIESERAIYKEQAASSGKPEKILDKIIEGKFKVFYERVCLVDQPFIKEPKESVGHLIDILSSKLGEKIALGRFVRFEIGAE